MEAQTGGLFVPELASRPRFVTRPRLFSCTLPRSWRIRDADEVVLDAVLALLGRKVAAAQKGPFRRRRQHDIYAFPHAETVHPDPDRTPRPSRIDFDARFSSDIVK